MEKFNLKQLLNNTLLFMSTDITSIIANYTTCCINRECKRCYFKKKYWSVENKSINTIPLLNFKDELELISNNNNAKILGRNGRYGITKSYYIGLYDKEIVVKNFRLKNINNVKTIELDIGGQRIDKIPSDIIQMLQHLYKLDKDVIPLYLSKSGIHILEYHEIKIHIEYNILSEDDGLTFDVYKWKNWRDKMKAQTYQIQNRGRGGGIFHITHPIIGLITKNYNKETLVLELDSEKFSIKKSKEIGDTSLYLISDHFGDLKNAIDFSRIDRQKILMINDNVSIFCINCQPIMSMSGFLGLVYSM